MQNIPLDFDIQKIENIEQLIEVLGYIHRPDIDNNGYNFFHAPIAALPIEEDVDFKIEAKGAYTVFSTNNSSFFHLLAFKK